MTEQADDGSIESRGEDDSDSSESIGDKVQAIEQKYYDDEIECLGESRDSDTFAPFVNFEETVGPLNSHILEVNLEDCSTRYEDVEIPEF